MAEEPVRIPIEHELDLHAFPPRDIKSVVEEYVDAAAAAGLREIRLDPWPRSRRPARHRAAALERHPLVVEFWDAPSRTSARPSHASACRRVRRGPRPGIVFAPRWFAGHSLARKSLRLNGARRAHRNICARVAVARCRSHQLHEMNVAQFGRAIWCACAARAGGFRTSARTTPADRHALRPRAAPPRAPRPAPVRHHRTIERVARPHSSRGITWRRAPRAVIAADVPPGSLRAAASARMRFFPCTS